jgi:tetrahydromethanopterin S-methyltransferase subunit G
MEDSSTNSQEPSLVQHAIKFGAIMGGIGFALTLLLYAVDYSLLADWKVGLLTFAVYIGIVIYGGINYRNQIGGFMPYGKAFQHGFIALAFGGLIGVIGNIIVYTVIDPELPQKVADIAIENTEKMMERFGAPADKIEESMAQVREDMPKKFGAVGQLIGFLWGLIIYAIIAAISGLIVRRNKPELM